MADITAPSAPKRERSSLLTNPRTRSLIIQGFLFIAVAVAFWFFIANGRANLAARNIATGFGFLHQTSGFDISQSLIRYDDIPHGLSVNYEDWKPGWGTAYGIGNTHDLTLWAFDKIPSDEQLVSMSRASAEPPILVCTPEYYHAQQALGRWSLPDRSTPALKWVEDQLETFVNFYRDQVDERSWYGFWNFGDIMHNYDFGRHEWRYDVGGWAWVNTELMPDILLWYSFLRTGRADYFRFAEAMTRHTSEVDVHHLGPFAPLGSRHNVNHWGDGAKQPRVSHAGLKRHYYFLTGGDGRIGDLLREQVNADLTYAYLQRFNGAHYVPNADGTPRLERPTNPVAPRPENFEPLPKPESRQLRDRCLIRLDDMYCVST